MTVCFIDTETTGLDPDRHEIWEVGLILPDGTEHLWQLPVDLSRADPMSLGMNGFHDRRAKAERTTDQHGTTTEFLSAARFAPRFAALTRGLHLAGAVVSFDADRLWRLLRANGECPMWHYHVIDVEALAAGWLGGRRKAWNEANQRIQTDACTLGLMNTEDGPQSYCRLHEWTNHEPSSSPTGAVPPWKSGDLSRAVGVNPADFDRHSALGDARWAKAIYEAVMGT